VDIIDQVLNPERAQQRLFVARERIAARKRKKSPSGPKRIPLRALPPL
jgi:hypothetical protein